MKKLNEEEQKKVSGGEKDVGGHHFYQWVSMYDGIKGRYYFVTEDGERNSNWFAGWLLDSYEESWGCFSHRVHKFKVDIGNKDYYKTIKEYGNDVTMWEYCNNLEKKPPM